MVTHLLHQQLYEGISSQGRMLRGEVIQPLTDDEICFTQLSQHMLHCLGCEHLQKLLSGTSCAGNIWAAQHKDVRNTCIYVFRSLDVRTLPTEPMTSKLRYVSLTGPFPKFSSSPSVSAHLLSSFASTTTARRRWQVVWACFRGRFARKARALPKNPLRQH